jgi:hypothetical protein
MFARYQSPMASTSTPQSLHGKRGRWGFISSLVVRVVGGLLECGLSGPAPSVDIAVAFVLRVACNVSGSLPGGLGGSLPDIADRSPRTSPGPAVDRRSCRCVGTDSGAAARSACPSFRAIHARSDGARDIDADAVDDLSWDGRRSHPSSQRRCTRSPSASQHQSRISETSSSSLPSPCKGAPASKAAMARSRRTLSGRVAGRRRREVCRVVTAGSPD